MLRFQGHSRYLAPPKDDVVVACLKVTLHKKSCQLLMCSSSVGIVDKHPQFLSCWLWRMGPICFTSSPPIIFKPRFYFFFLTKTNQTQQNHKNMHPPNKTKQNNSYCDHVFQFPGVFWNVYYIGLWLCFGLGILPELLSVQTTEVFSHMPRSRTHSFNQHFSDI